MFRGLAIILIISVGHVLSDEVDQNKPCGPHMFKGMDRCCKLPDLIPFPSFDPCMKKDDETKKEVAKETKSNQQGKEGTKKGGRMCLIQCGMRNENMLDANGNVNTTAVSIKLTAVAESHWDPLVPGAIENCTAEFNKLDLSEIPVHVDSDGQVCNPGPALFLSCINHRLSSECPSNALGTIDPQCPDRFTYLKKCNPFSLIEGWKKRTSKGGKSSGRSAHSASIKKESRRGKNKKNKN